jgi:hypothetical protein
MAAGNSSNAAPKQHSIVELADVGSEKAQDGGA